MGYCCLQFLYKEQLSSPHVSDLPSSPCPFQRTGLFISSSVSALHGDMCNFPCLYWKSGLAIIHHFSSLPTYCCPQLTVSSIKQCYLMESRKCASLPWSLPSGIISPRDLDSPHPDDCQEAVKSLALLPSLWAGGRL